MDDPRPDEVLVEAARVAYGLGLRLGWTDGLSGKAAKGCSGVGSAAWKKAAALNGEEGAATGYFVGRCRKRNPVVPAIANRLVLVEIDLDFPDNAYPSLADVESRVAATLRRLDLRFPRSVVVRSRRGVHIYARPASGCLPAKFQITEHGNVTAATDGYVVGVPGLHELPGVVYEYIRVGEIAQLPEAVQLRLDDLAGDAHADTRHRFANGEPIPKGDRDVALFWRSVDLLRDGLSQAAVFERVLEANRSRCVPPLAETLVRKQFRGAVRWVASHPTEVGKARREARRILDQRLAGVVADPEPVERRGKRVLQRYVLSAVTAKPVEWLIPGVVPVATLMMVAGVGGLGKTGLLLAWLARVTEAGRNVIVVSYEDAAEQVLRPRAEALGADLDRFHALYVDVLEGGISFPTDLPELDRHVRETRAAAVLIDPVSAAIDLKLDAHRDQDVRVVLGQLAKLAEREEVAVLENAHLNKTPSADPYLRINGSTAFYNSARSVVTVTKDPVDPEWQRLVAHQKSNYGPLVEVERWRVVPMTIPSPTGPIETMKMEFVEIAGDVSRDDVLAARTPGAEKLYEAIAFLEGSLADGDWHDSAGLVILARAQSISERTLRRAALDELHVEHERRGFPASTWWRLPGHATPSPQDLA